MYQQSKSKAFESKVNFRQASNYCKRVLETAKLGSWDFWRIANSVFNKGKFTIPPLFNGPEMLPSASGKAKLFASKLF